MRASSTPWRTRPQDRPRPVDSQDGFSPWCAIDLLFEDEDGWTLVDYKSDTVGANRCQLVAFYAPQIALYRRYWERLTGARARAGLFFLHTGEVVWPDDAGPVSR